MEVRLTNSLCINRVRWCVFEAGTQNTHGAAGLLRIEDVFTRNVQETMIEMEQEAVTGVRIGGRDENRVIRVSLRSNPEPL